ncbi:unnamed protein product [Paramecium pentaurelia]|uniref:Uncharacterized protein n=1 Tax=Paramecium pentaurelia TaxID=43138 RepID=A0A8S1U925_9CILI|nr:unnamed protein product [Paramecium pentaurelia]
MNEALTQQRGKLYQLESENRSFKTFNEEQNRVIETLSKQKIN